MSRAGLWRFLAVALPTLGALIAPMPSVDLAFQLRAGSDILGKGAIPSVDGWTFTVSGTPWLDQQWGAQVLLQLVYGGTGWTGLAVLRAALVAVAFWLLLATVRKRAPTLPAAAATLVVVAAFIVSAEALALRPQLFAIDLFAATLVILAVRDEHPRLVWLIPPIALAWANLHGTFLLAPALCGLAWLADLYDRAGRGAAGPAANALAAATPSGTARPGRPVHEMLLVAVVSAAATLVNPFGLDAWRYVANLTANPTIASRVSEWQPPSPLTPNGALVWLSVLAVALLAAFRVRRAIRAGGASPAATAGQAQDGGDAHAAGESHTALAHRRGTAFRAPYVIPWPALLTLLVFGGFALVSGRGQAWWPFAAAFVIAPWLAQIRPSGAPSAGNTARHVARTDPTLLRRLNGVIAAALIIIGVALLPAWRPVGLVGVPLGTLTFAPQGIAAEVRTLTASKAGPCDDRVWNPQAWGSWLEFAAPCARYAVDSRIELFPVSVWDDADTVAAGAPGWDLVLAQEGATIVVTDRSTDSGLDAALLGSRAWSSVYADCDGTVWVPAEGDVIEIAQPSTSCP